MLIVAALLGVLGFVPVAVRLYELTVRQYDYYAQKALQNQSRTTSVAADRGYIYDTNMNVLACSVTVEHVYLDPHELKQAGTDVEALSLYLGKLLNVGGDPPFQSPPLRKGGDRPERCIWGSC